MTVRGRFALRAARARVSRVERARLLESLSAGLGRHEHRQHQAQDHEAGRHEHGGAHADRSQEQRRAVRGPHGADARTSVGNNSLG